MTNWSLLIVLGEHFSPRTLLIVVGKGRETVQSSEWFWNLSCLQQLVKKAAGKISFHDYDTCRYTHMESSTHNSVLKTNPVTVDMYCGIFSICHAHMFGKRIERGRRKRSNSWLLTFEESTAVIPACMTGGSALSQAHLHSVFLLYSSTYKEIILVTQGKQKRFQFFLHLTIFIINILSKRSYESLDCLSYEGVRFSVEQVRHLGSKLCGWHGKLITPFCTTSPQSSRSHTSYCVSTAYFSAWKKPSCYLFAADLIQVSQHCFWCDYGWLTDSTLVSCKC